MAVLAADINVSTFGTPTKLSFSANVADTYFKGAVVFIDDAGGVQVVPAAGDRCAGIASKNQVIATAADEVEVYVDGYFEMPLGTNIAAADEGNFIGLDIGTTQSDNIADFVSLEIAADDVAIAVNDCVLGRIIRVKAASMIVCIHPALMGKYEATAGSGIIE